VDPYLAESLGEFRRHGLAVEITAVPATAKAMEALAAGNAEVILGTYEQAIQMERRGLEVSPVAVLDTCHCLALVSLHPEVRTVADLKGRIVGVAGPGGQMQNFARFLLGGQEASYAAIGAGPSAVTAIENGRVDAGVVLFSAFDALRKRHPNLRVLAETFSPEGMKKAFGVTSYPSKTLLATTRWVRENPERAAALRLAFLATARWMRTHAGSEVLDRLPADVRGPDRETSLRLLELVRPHLTLDGAVPPGADAVVRSVVTANR
jgi:NitT/TauT family transport system substrate-binding protein